MQNDNNIIIQYFEVRLQFYLCVRCAVKGELPRTF